jgi:hypothetical protein
VVLPTMCSSAGAPYGDDHRVWWPAPFPPIYRKGAFCPADPEEPAEAFVLRRMDPSEASAYEEHLARCQACAEVVEATRAFVQGMRDAGRQIVDDDK